jgi:hypothetical protein
MVVIVRVLRLEDGQAFDQAGTIDLRMELERPEGTSRDTGLRRAFAGAPRRPRRR